MKIKRYNESKNNEDIVYDISEMFFEKCGNFASENYNNVKGLHLLMFYFPVVTEQEFEQINKCREFINTYDGFYLESSTSHYGNTDIKLVITLREYNFNKLAKKLEITNSSKKYNI